jgi:hypothetical protein
MHTGTDGLSAYRAERLAVVFQGVAGTCGHKWAICRDGDDYLNYKRSRPLWRSRKASQLGSLRSISTHKRRRPLE